MSHRRKHVSQAAEERSPELLEGQSILRVCGPRGSNLLEVRSVPALCRSSKAALCSSLRSRLPGSLTAAASGGGRYGHAAACPHAEQVQQAAVGEAR